MAAVRASIRSATASACTRSIRPFNTARRVNSPGEADRAPAATHAASTSVGTTCPPCVEISTTSSPVYERGAAYHVMSASSSGTPFGWCNITRVARRGCKSDAPRARAMSTARAPDSRITAIAPSPAAVERATIVSSPPGSWRAVTMSLSPNDRLRLRALLRDEPLLRQRREVLHEVIQVEP